MVDTVVLDAVIRRIAGDVAAVNGGTMKEVLHHWEAHWIAPSANYQLTQIIALIVVRYRQAKGIGPPGLSGRDTLRAPRGLRPRTR